VMVVVVVIVELTASVTSLVIDRVQFIDVLCILPVLSMEAEESEFVSVWLSAYVRVHRLPLCLSVPGTPLVEFSLTILPQIRARAAVANAATVANTLLASERVSGSLCECSGAFRDVGVSVADTAVLLRI
jgi:hypothetical protein